MNRVPWQRVLAALTVTCALTMMTSMVSWAATEGSIDHAETSNGKLRILYSIPATTTSTSAADGELDLSSLEVSVNGEPVEAEAEMAGSAGRTAQIRRTAIMAIDTSNSMRGERFLQAKAAAKAFLNAAPEDVYVGVVAFDRTVDVVQKPTLDRAAALGVVDDLSLSLETHLYDGVIAAVGAAGSDGQRTLLVLSDGRDTSSTRLKDALKAIADADVRVDVVAVGEAAQANPPLEALASQGRGAVVAAEDPDALTALFQQEAAALARQVLITAGIPADAGASEGSLEVSLKAGGETYTDNAFVSFGQAPASPMSPEELAAPATPSMFSSPNVLWGGLSALGVGVLVVLLGALGVVGKRDVESLEDKISVYTRVGATKSRRAAEVGRNAATDQPKSVAGSAISMTEKALAGNQGLEAKLANKLEGAALSLKPAEWLLTHAGIAIGAATLGYLISAGSGPMTALFLGVGALFPWLFLGVKKTRRLKAFNAQLAETLQLLSGSLSAGLSLAQSLDTIVREGNDPIAGEFKRALIESRLGVAVEDSLDSIAKRMESADFEWVVMAIRIQREVGGNLAELLLKVAGTMRERDYLRRQVKTLSAEGRMSAWILGGLPPAMLAYMMMTNPEYLSPLITRPIGWLLLGMMVVLMLVGGFWMSRVVKVDV